MDAIELQEFEPTNANATPAHRSIVLDDPPSQERKAMSTNQSNAQRDVNTNFVVRDKRDDVRQAQSKPSYDQLGKKEDSHGQEGDAVYRKYLREKITNNIEEEPSVFIQVKPQNFTDPSDNIRIAADAQQ